MVTRRLAAALVAAAFAVRGAPLLVNGDFAKAQGDQAAWPTAWVVPAEAGWVHTNEDGATDQWSLRCAPRTLLVGKPATQAITLSANTDYVLKAALKTDGVLRPLVRIMAGDKELARLACPPQAAATRWQGVSVRFASGAATQAVVELWADGRHATGTATPAGTAGLDDVQVLTVAEAAASAGAPADAAHENIAKGCSYTVEPLPNYSLCTDRDDKVQLTDGIYTMGYFWTQKTTVGWQNARPVAITLDLGADVPVRGLSYNTAAGVATVEFPASVMALISVDGRSYYALGDLVTLSLKRGVPPVGKYGVHRYVADEMKAHGRYVKLLIDPAGPYCFIDEIEVFRGEAEWTNLPMVGKEIRYPMEYFQDNQFNAAVKRRIGYDLEAARASVLAADLEAPVLTTLKAEISAIEKGLDVVPQLEAAGFSSVFPLNELHARVYALYGAARAAKGVAPLTAWGANPWDFLQPADLPEKAPAAAVRIAAMRGETRAGAVNLTNSTAKPLRLKLAFAGFSDGSAAADLTVHEVPWTDTYEGTPVAAALPVLAPTAAGYELTVPAGMTRQVYFTFRPVKTPAGTHAGQLNLSGEGVAALSVPVTLRVFDLDFPAQPALHVGGWDYTDSDSQYGVTLKNREALIAHLQERYVDSPWGTGAVMPFGSFGPDGQFTKTPDTSRFDTWIGRWPKARRYCVYNSVGNTIGDAKIGDPTFAPRVVSWIRFWVQYLRSKDIQPEQLVLLLVDEPNRQEQDRVIVAWAQVIQAAEPAVVIWEDPTYKEPDKALPEMMAISDVLCPHRPMLLEAGKPFADFFKAQQAAGRRLDFYSCSGPAFLLDPYSYHRLQAWTCFEYGAESSFFWAFGDTGGGNPWNAYTAVRTAYAPAFVGPDSITAGKHMEAIRESVGDFEYLTWLRRRIAEVEKATPQQALLPAARALLAAAPGRVLETARADNLRWREPKDRTLADTVRIEIGEMLERLK
jgi:hypothetical protein